MRVRHTSRRSAWLEDRVEDVSVSQLAAQEMGVELDSYAPRTLDRVGQVLARLIETLADRGTLDVASIQAILDVRGELREIDPR